MQKNVINRKNTNKRNGVVSSSCIH